MNILLKWIICYTCRCTLSETTKRISRWLPAQIILWQKSLWWSMNCREENKKAVDVVFNCMIESGWIRYLYFSVDSWYSLSMWWASTVPYHWFANMNLAFWSAESARRGMIIRIISLSITPTTRVNCVFPKSMCSTSSSIWVLLRCAGWIAPFVDLGKVLVYPTCPLIWNWWNKGEWGCKIGWWQCLWWYFGYSANAVAGGERWFLIVTIDID